MSDIYAMPRLSRERFTLGSVRFLDANGTPYAPSKVEKFVQAEDGTIITNWTEVGDTSGFENGDDIEISPDEVELQDENALFERHIVLIVGDRNTDTEIKIRVIVQVQNPLKLP